MFRCYSYTIIRERIKSCLLKSQLLKQSNNWCNCNTETCRRCFNENCNVNFNIIFKTTHQCISW